jgi:hypothetical protein
MVISWTKGVKEAAALFCRIENSPLSIAAIRQRASPARQVADFPHNFLPADRQQAHYTQWFTPD